MFTARRTTLFCLVVLLWTSCSPTQRASAPDTAAAAPEAQPTPTEEQALFGQLRVFITDQTTDGRNIKLRGLVQNPYPQAVDGVRVTCIMIGGSDAEMHELDRAQKVMEVSLASGERKALRWDVQTMYAGAAGARFLLQAFAIERGGEELPIPPGWKE